MTEIAPAPERKLRLGVMGRERMNMKENGGNENERPGRGEIAVRAFAVWQKEGCPQGRYLQHWLWAVKQTQAEGRRAAGFLPQKIGRENRG